MKLRYSALVVALASATAAGGTSSGGGLRRSSSYEDDYATATAAAVDADADAEEAVDLMSAADLAEYRRSLMDGMEEEEDHPMHAHSHKDFSPLSCNLDAMGHSELDWTALCAPGAAATFSSLVDAAAEAGGDEVIVPCGTCALVDYSAGEHVTIPGGINVLGHLRFPQSADVTLRTTSVIVQGVFSTESPPSGATVPSADGRKVKMLLYGSEEKLFTPHEENKMACGGNATWDGECNVGKRAFVVAGGRMDVRAIDTACPSWERLQAITSSVTPPSNPTPGPDVAIPLPPSCSRTIVDVDWKVGDAPPSSTGVHEPPTVEAVDPANSGAAGEDGYVTQYAEGVGGGTYYDVPDVGCVVADETYLVTMNVRLRPPSPGGQVRCSTDLGYNGECPAVFLDGNQRLGKVGWNGNEIKKDFPPNIWRVMAFTMSVSQAQLDAAGAGPLRLLLRGVTDRMDVDWIKIELPSEASLPQDVEGACSDLLSINGDMSRNGFHPYPYTLENGGNVLKIMEEDDPDSSVGGKNKFLRIERYNNFRGIRTDLLKGCVLPNSEYTIRMRWRYGTANADKTKLGVQFRWWNGGTKTERYIDTCFPPSTYESTDWHECELSYTIPDEASGADRYNVHILNWDRDKAAYFDVDDLSFSRPLTPPVGPPDTLVLSEDAARCWGPGSQLVVTSDTDSQDDQHVVTITSSSVADDGTGTGLVTVDTVLQRTTTAEDDPEFPVEVALLDRNFILQGESDPDDDFLHGGHFIVLHTPDVVQVIEGILVQNFGQQGLLGRYPIHFHMCRAVEGSLVSRNVVRDSNQRGVVIHGSHNVTVSDNVLMEVKGHGFFLEDGIEQHNSFLRNLGTGIRGTQRLVPSGNEVESDMSPSVFWMSNTANTWVDNVSAGSSHIGYWIEMNRGLARGPHRNSMPTFDRTVLPLTLFRDNDAHSSKVHGMSLYPNIYKPTETALIQNFRSYRNGENGVLVHADRNVKLIGGVLADNGRCGIQNQLADDTVLEGVRIVGMRDVYQEVLGGYGRDSGCHNVMGVWYHPERFFDEAERSVTLKNVQFTDFTCTGSHAIVLEDNKIEHGINSAKLLLDEGVTFAPDTVSRVTSCDVDVLGVDTVTFEDFAGALSEDGTSPGFAVSATEGMKPFFGTCEEMSWGSCLHYCEGACLQTVIVHTDNMESDVQISVTDGTTTAVSAKKENGDYILSLPQGTFTATFLDSNGQVAYPDFAWLDYLSPPKCTKGETTLNLVLPDPSDPYCDELIGNGDIEDTENPLGGFWSWNEPNVTSPGADGTGSAVMSTSRRYWSDKLMKYVPVWCFAANATYEITGKFKVVDSTDLTTPVPCGVEGSIAACPGAIFLRNNHQTYNWPQTFSSSYDGTGWGTFEGRLTIPDMMAGSDWIAVGMYDGSRTFTGQIVLDDYRMTRVTEGAAASS